MYDTPSPTRQVIDSPLTASCWSQLVAADRSVRMCSGWVGLRALRAWRCRQRGSGVSGPYLLPRRQGEIIRRSLRRVREEPRRGLMAMTGALGGARPTYTTHDATTPHPQGGVQRTARPRFRNTGTRSIILSLSSIPQQGASPRQATLAGMSGATLGRQQYLTRTHPLVSRCWSFKFKVLMRGEGGFQDRSVATLSPETLSPTPCPSPI